MLDWLGDALRSVVSSLGQGVASLLSWLLSGLISVVTKILSAADGIFGLLDALFDFFISIKDSALGLITVFFPWIPAEVSAVISLGFFAILLAGLVKKVSGK